MSDINVVMPNVTVTHLKTSNTWTFIVTRDSWSAYYIRNATFHSKEEAMQMARNFKKLFKADADAIEQGRTVQHFILNNDRFAGKFKRVVKATEVTEELPF